MARRSDWFTQFLDRTDPKWREKIKKYRQQLAEGTTQRGGHVLVDGRLQAVDGRVEVELQPKKGDKK